MKRPLSLAVLLLALAASIAAVYLYRENRALRRQLAAAVSAPPATTDAQSSAEALTGAASGSETTAGAVRATAEVATAGGRAGIPGRGAGRRGGEWRDRGSEAMTRMLTDPEMRVAALSRAKAQVDRVYGDLFVKLGLNEVQVELLRTLLAERELAQTEAGVLQRAADTDQARDEARAWRDAKFASIDAGIDSVLGPNGTQMLRDHQQSLPQRDAVEEVGRRASYVGAPLSGEASDHLVQLLAQVQRDVPAQNPLYRGGGFDPATAATPDNGRGPRQREPLTPDAVNGYLAALETQNQALLQQARNFLTPLQLEALADRQLEQYEQTQQQLDLVLKNPDLPVGGFGGGRGGFGGGRGGQRGVAP